MVRILKLLVAMAVLMAAVPVPAAHASDKSAPTTKKKTVDRSKKVDKFIDENNDGVNDLLQQKVVKPTAKSAESHFVAPQTAKQESAPKAAKPVKPQPQKPKATDSSKKTEDKQIKEPPKKKPR